MTNSKTGLKFSAHVPKLDDTVDEFVLVPIEEHKRGRQVSRTFFGKIPRTRLRADAKKEIERWCGLYPESLPENGGTVRIDLNYVRRRQ